MSFGKANENEESNCSWQKYKFENNSGSNIISPPFEAANLTIDSAINKFCSISFVIEYCVAHTVTYLLISFIGITRDIIVIIDLLIKYIYILHLHNIIKYMYLFEVIQHFKLLLL